MISFTEEQIKFLKETYDIEVNESIKIRDGYVTKESSVWWWYEYVPEKIIAAEHWRNIKYYPHLYSIKKPSGKFVYDELEK